MTENELIKFWELKKESLQKVLEFPLYSPEGLFLGNFNELELIIIIRSNFLEFPITDYYVIYNNKRYTFNQMGSFVDSNGFPDYDNFPDTMGDALRKLVKAQAYKRRQNRDKNE